MVVATCLGSTATIVCTMPTALFFVTLFTPVATGSLTSISIATR